MSNVNICSICGKVLEPDEWDGICPLCYRDWNEDDDDWTDELGYAWPSIPDLEGEDLFSDWPITGTEER